MHFHFHEFAYSFSRSLHLFVAFHLFHYTNCCKLVLLLFLIGSRVLIQRADEFAEFLDLVDGLIEQLLLEEASERHVLVVLSDFMQVMHLGVDLLLELQVVLKRVQAALEGVARGQLDLA